MQLTIAGIDPALSNFGLAKGVFDTVTYGFRPTEIQLIRTESRSGKTVRKNSDDLRRAAESCVATQKWVQNCHVVFAEVPTGSQSARASFSNGVCLGILSSIGSVTGEGAFSGRLIQVLPHEVKLAAVGSKHASKEEMIEWAHDLWPELGWIKTKRKGELRLSPMNEHMADALATINAGLQTDEFQNLKAAISAISEVKS